MTPEAVIRALLGRPVGVTVLARLAASPVHQTWQVAVGGGLMVLRVDGPGASRLGLNRRAEPDVLRAMAAEGIGPACHGADPARGWLLTEWLPGEACSAADLAAPAGLLAAAALLCRVHAMPLAGPVLDLPAAVGRYAAAAGEGAQALAASVRAQLARCLALDQELPVFCHGDPTPPNFIRSPLRLIDWEYAGRTHPGFDRAGFSVGAGLSGAAGDAWLGACLGRQPGPGDRARHAAWEAFCRGLGELWLAALPAPGPDPVVT